MQTTRGTENTYDVMLRVEKALKTTEAFIQAELNAMNTKQTQQAEAFIQEARADYLDAQKYYTSRLYT
ncbi:hypothetical protein [Alkalicoccobacillus plakortidis]|uniref:Uncharacterized protein n=1 Tax=Alkalicoccobacillus plakortidis TaxID=444060 RepID=A0ABT0XEV9_9BACI|nr:hypothetical protein [Alkalicoccobacillus plakortidis]MCM2674437.1 hypothetical protein [Alkalicoccobacillus plakortidis]